MKRLLHIASSVLVCMAAISCTSDNAASPSADGAQGQGGSMARFAISGNHLYTVDHSSLNIFDISTPEDPQQGQSLPIGFGIETIFPFEDMLFIGTQTGMHIFSVKNPAFPQHISQYQHVVSCDPVVTDGRYAYVTLSTGTACRLAINELQVIDLQNINDPTLLKQYSMTNPKGLGIANTRLFVCDEGLKVYNATDVMNLELEHHFRINAFDVIPDNGRLLVIGSDGLYQYQYEDEKLVLLSTISIKPAI
ncbi:hypothetical protein I0P70_12380 [Pontibacter sp. FD36]|uniref:LVIVD repeat-containing protein n=1 Tax=Pontibacter sp. FD36 TaxID=2789860 RepID=UPI0018A965C0|nr:hypothetical protein [Pontibacter sp. FD36]MBF8964044.1 hypothetical protein [Pontibacter sp. FD36]